MRSTRKLQDQPANQEHHRTGQHGQTLVRIAAQQRKHAVHCIGVQQLVVRAGQAHGVQTTARVT